MGEVARDQQKCLLPIEGRPILGYILDALIQAYGSVDLKVGVSFKQEDVKNFIDSNKSPKISVTYVPHPIGSDSWGAYKTMEGHIKGLFVGLPGDVIVSPEVYRKAMEEFERSKAEVVISLSPRLSEADTHGLAVVEGGRVVKYLWPVNDPEPREGLLRDITVYASDGRFFKLLERYKNPNNGLGKVFACAVDNGSIIGTNYTETPWIHVAYPEDLYKKVANE